MNCSYLSRDRKLARLAEFQPQQPEEDSQRIPPSGVMAPPPTQSGKRHGDPGYRRTQYKRARVGLPRPRPDKVDALDAKVDTLASQFAEVKQLLLSLQPDRPASQAEVVQDVVLPSQPPSRSYDEDHEDSLSTRASCTEFREEPDQGDEDTATGASYTRSSRSGSDCRGDSGSNPTSVKPVIRMALARLGLDEAATTTTATRSGLLRRARPQAAFSVPVSEDYVKELHKCWEKPSTMSHHVSDARALASMRDAATYGLGEAPPVESSITSLVCSPVEAVRPVSRCPRPQCRTTDDLLVKCYNIAARIGRIGNSMSHLGMALNQSLHSSASASSGEAPSGAESSPGVDASVLDLSDVSLDSLAYMATELSRLLSTITLARRQVWLAQSPLPDLSRNVIRTLPVIPGEVFGAAAQQALERSLQAQASKEQYASIKGPPPLTRQQSAQGYGASRSRPPAQQDSYQRPPANDRSDQRRRAPSRPAPQTKRGQGFRSYKDQKGHRGRP